MQLVAVNIYLKLQGDEPEDGYVDSLEYQLGYRDALKRAMKFYKAMAKGME